MVALAVRNYRGCVGDKLSKKDGRQHLLVLENLDSNGEEFSGNGRLIYSILKPP